ncbi:pilus assembly protein TadG-related protein [Streptomyces sp. NPDC098789]|uniref:pilus assembly protein TadG-related protein n=1 Tax=Streptomyces sp. NPDC098789 TaxID=3366098 RepID=UPI003814C0FD
MIPKKAGDQGQAFPVYIVVVAGMLFAAFAFFAVGQAALTRSNAQGAADAAALAAAGDARDHLLPGLDFTKLKPEDWKKILDGNWFDAAGACGAAAGFAAQNDASSTCTSAMPRFTVQVRTNGTVGRSVIPGTSSLHGTATATAVIEPRCQLGPPASGAGGSPDKPDPVEIRCTGGSVITFDPLNPDPWRILARSLFDVRLVN